MIRGSSGQSSLHWLICTPNPEYEAPDPRSSEYEGLDGIFRLLSALKAHIEDDVAQWEYEIEHSDDCERAEIYKGKEHLYTEWRCWVANESENGEDLHRMLREVKEPGRYPFVAWVEIYRNHWEPDDADGGLQWYEYEEPARGTTLIR